MGFQGYWVLGGARAMGVLGLLGSLGVLGLLSALEGTLATESIMGCSGYCALGGARASRCTRGVLTLLDALGDALVTGASGLLGRSTVGIVGGGSALR